MTGQVPPGPCYLGDPVADALAHVVCELTAELWAVKRRLRLLEAEREAGGGTPLDELPVGEEEARASALAAREFVASVLSAFADVTAGGPVAGALPTRRLSRGTNRRTMAEIDLLVAGAGGGLAGALRAAKLGRSVLVAEANPAFRRGNNTSMSTAMVPGAGSRFQRAAGIDDSPDRFTADVRAKTHGEADPTVTGALADVSARLVEWLADDLGLPIELVTDFDYPGHSVCRCHTVPGRSGAALLRLLYDATRAAGIDIMVPARVDDVTPGPDGLAVRLAFPDGGSESITAGAVLLATNGFGADQELVKRYIPEMTGAVYHGSEASRGDALRIGERFGAGVGYLDAYQGHGGLAARAGTLAGWATVMHGGVIVNNGGQRFADESQGYSEFARIELTQPGHWAAIVFDDRIYDRCLLFEDFRQTVDSGVVRQADTVDGIADALGVPAAALGQTLAEAARSAAGEPDRFGRTHWTAALRPPYRAVVVEPALFHTQGGLLVDARARVLTADRRPVPGLYAAGGAAIGISGHGAAGYLAGNGLLSALGLSFLAAEDVASGYSDKT